MSCISGFHRSFAIQKKDNFNETTVKVIVLLLTKFYSICKSITPTTKNLPIKRDSLVPRIGMIDYHGLLSLS